MRLNTTTCAALAIAAASFLSIAPAQAQAVFEPVPVSGFDRDVIAESLPATGSTNASLDYPANNFVLLANSHPAALPSDGRVTAPDRTYQLAGFAGPNAVQTPFGATTTLTLTTPRSFEQLSLLGLATEGGHDLSVEVVFEGGATQPAVVAELRDWSEPTGAIGGDFARVQRGTDLIQTPYRMFAVDVPIRPEDRLRRVTAVRITNVAPFCCRFSNILAVSGVAGPVAVPTLGEWAMILLAGLLLMLGAGQAMRARRT